MTIEQQRALAIASARMRAAQQQQQPQQQEEPSWGANALEAAKNVVMHGGPMAGAVKFGTPVMKAIEGAPEKAGGYVTDVTGSPAAGALTKGALTVAPMLVGSGAGAKIGAKMEPGMKWVAKRLMRSALKPSPALAGDKGERAVQTLLDHNINLSAAGMNKLKGEIEVLKSEVTGAIQRATARQPFPSITKTDVAKEVGDVFDKFKNQVLNAKDLRTVSRATKEFMENPTIKHVMTPEQAQKIKEGTYKMLGEKAYGELKTAEVETAKALARGLRKGIEKQVPEVAAKNATASDLINAGNRASTRLKQAENRNIGGLAWLYTHPSSFAAFEFERSPALMSGVANLVNRGAKAIPTEAMRIGGGAAGALAIPFLDTTPTQPSAPAPQANPVNLTTPALVNGVNTQPVHNPYPSDFVRGDGVRG